MRVAVLITCHNRKSKTIECLRRLCAQSLPPETVLDTYLVDDGSTDGTSAEVRSAFPEVHIIPANGTLFWSGGMRLAWEHASQDDPDAYLWLNDDTMLYPGAVACLITTANRCGPCIAVGSCRDPLTGGHTYGGGVLKGRHPAQISAVLPGKEDARFCDTFNGNCVLVNRSAFRMLGLMRPFKHAIADTDYGLSASRMRIPVLLAPDYVATCQGNPADTSWANPDLPRMLRMRLLLSPKGLPPVDWWKFLWQHAGPRALAYWPRPYLRVLAGR